MAVCEFRAHCASVPILRQPAGHAEALYRPDGLDEDLVLSARTQRMMLVTSLVGAGIWSLIFQLIF